MARSEHPVDRIARLDAGEAVTLMDLVGAIAEAGADNAELAEILSHLFCSGRVRFKKAVRGNHQIEDWSDREIKNIRARLV